MSSEAWRWDQMHISNPPAWINHPIEGDGVGPRSCYHDFMKYGDIYKCTYCYEEVHCKRGEMGYWPAHEWRAHPSLFTYEPEFYRCIHCGHTKNLDRKDNKMEEYGVYRLVKGKEPQTVGTYVSRIQAERDAEGYAERYGDEGFTYIVTVGNIYKKKKKETITDEDGKKYTVDRAPNNLIRITAPCGDARTFSKEQLTKLLKDD